MDLKLLEDIGLSEGETKVYLALLKLGQTKTGPLIREANVSSSKVYKIISRLQKKGLVGEVTKSKTKYFSAQEPKRILDYIEQRQLEIEKKKQQVKEMLPQLEMQKNLGNKTQATIFEGTQGIINFYNNLLEDLKPGQEYFVLGAGYGPNPQTTRSFFENYHTRRSKKKIKVNLLANFDTKGNLVPATKKYSEIRYLPQYLLSNMFVIFYKNKSFIVLWSETPYGFLIESEETAKGFRTYFDTFWKIAEK